MAENKKGFILYADQQELFNQLSDEQAGKLIKHIYSYVNDESPECEDIVTKLAFTPIRQQFKRDLEKWEKTRGSRSKAGKASAEARRNKKEQDATNLTHVDSVQQTSTNPTVNDNVNVNVKVNVNDILLEKETKELFKVWIDYRKEIKKAIKSDKTLVTLAKRIQKEGLEKSTQVVNTSIENGWQGLFWDKQPPKETPGELIDGYRNPTNGKININELTKKINGTAS